MNNNIKEYRATVYIVRHGVTQWNEQKIIVGHHDLSLSERGKAQADGLRRLLEPCRINRALTSPLARTRETADRALAKHKLSANVDPRLIELKLKGWEGKSKAELRDDPEWKKWIATPHLIATPEGERLEHVRERAAQALEDGLKGLPDKGGLAIFTHGGVARVLLLDLLGMPLSCYQKIGCDCASLSAIEVDQKGQLARTLVLNLTEPLVAFG